MSSEKKKFNLEPFYASCKGGEKKKKKKLIM